MVAAFRNLYVSEVRRGQPESWRVVIGNVRWARVCKRKIGSAGGNIEHRTPRVELRTLSTWCSVFRKELLNDLAQLADLIQPDERVYLRQLVMQFFRKPLRHAAAYD